MRLWDIGIGPLGIWTVDDSLFVRTILNGQKENGICLVDGDGTIIETVRIADEFATGSVYHVGIAGLPSYAGYLLYEDGKTRIDPLGQCFSGKGIYPGICKAVSADFDWSDDVRPCKPLRDCVLYGMHVKGFTARLNMKEAGTFAGVTKKLSTLTDLGIDGVVLQPAYEFDSKMAEGTNYWGYVKGYYMAPKASYSYSDNQDLEFKTMVKALHKAGIRCFMQFYFEPSQEALTIRDILLHWVLHYHIDGFWVMGAEVPYDFFVKDPYLTDTIFIGEGITFPGEEMYPSGTDTDYRLIDCKRDFMDVSRRFLKGDENMLQSFLRLQREQFDKHGNLHYLASYNGFRLMDVFSYNEKHNEDNGEENRDGETYNNSWNCGIEGKTKKRSVLSLRNRLFKNALTLLFSSHGIPFLFMGDEWGKSAEGNNNPYCQDNEITWQKWNLTDTEKERLLFTKQLIALRKQFTVLHPQTPMTFLDLEGTGFPDISYHGKEAWKIDAGSNVRSAGVLLTGEVVEHFPSEILYIAMNMHWDEKELALPKLPKGKYWEKLLSTVEQEEDTQAEEKVATKVVLPGRCIQIYMAK